MSRTLVAILVALGTAVPASAQDTDTDAQASQAAEAPPAELTVEPSGVSVSAGPVVISRSMQMRLGTDTLSHSPGIYIGGTLRLEVEAVDFESVDAKLLVEGEGGYGGTKNSEVAAELNREPITEWSAIALRATVRRQLSEALDLDVGLGAFANSFIVEPNLTYTGHRYVGAELRVGLDWAKPSSSWALGADASAYPVLSVNQSSGEYGESSAFGARAGAQVGYNVFALASSGGYAGGRIMLRYDFSRFRSQFPEGRIAIGGGVSEDNMHAVTLMFGYFM